MKSSVFATSALVGNETSCPVCPIREEKTKLMHLRTKEENHSKDQKQCALSRHEKMLGSEEKQC